VNAFEEAMEIKVVLQEEEQKDGTIGRVLVGSY